MVIGVGIMWNVLKGMFREGNILGGVTSGAKQSGKEIYKGAVNPIDNPQPENSNNINNNKRGGTPEEWKREFQKPQ
jgi:hypothetical protein